jgi:fatty-acid desaturase
MFRISRQKQWLMMVTFLLVSGGFIIGYWEISVVGIICAAFGGAPIAAIFFGLLLDLAYGAPSGLEHYLFFPFGLLALLCSIVRWFGIRYMLEHRAQERL